MAGKTSRTHMPVMPPGFITLRILQLLAAVSLFGISIWLMLYFLSVGALCGLIGSTLSLIILLWEIPAESCAPRAYNYWAVLTFEVILFTDYILAMVWLIIDATFRNLDYSDCRTYDYYYKTSIDPTSCLAEKRRENEITRMLYGGAGLSALLFIFYLTSLIIVGSAITKHRTAGGHNYFGSQPTAQLVAVLAPPSFVYVQHPAPVYTEHQTAYHQQPQMQHGQSPADYADLQQRYTQLQAQHATLQQQVQMGSTGGPVELKGNL